MDQVIIPQNKFFSTQRNSIHGPIYQRDFWRTGAGLT